MRFVLSLATAAAVFGWAAPATAADYTICEGDAVGGSGKARVRAISEVILVEPGVDLKRAWQNYVLPQLKDLQPDAIHKANCWPATDDRVLVSQVRTTRINASRAGRIMVIPAKFNEVTARQFATANSTPLAEDGKVSDRSSSSNTTHTEDRTSSRGSKSTSGSTNAERGAVASPEPRTAKVAEHFTWCVAHNGDGATPQSRTGGPKTYLSHVFPTSLAAGPLSEIFAQRVPRGFVSRCHPGFATQAEADASRQARDKQFPNNRPISIPFDPD